MTQIEFNGSHFEVKKLDDYCFASYELYDELFRGGDDPINQDAEIVNDSISHYFDNDVFKSNSETELYSIYLYEIFKNV